MTRTRRWLVAVAAFSGLTAARAVLLEPVPQGQDADGTIALQVLPGSAAEKAGVRIGDLFLTLDGADIKSCPDLTAKAKAASGTVPVTIRRAGKTETLSVTLPPAESKGPHLGVMCSSPDMHSACRIVGGNSISVTVSAIRRLTGVHVVVTNGTDHPIHVTPDMVTAADGALSMLKRLDNADVTAIFQGDATPPAAAVAPAPASTGSSPAQALTGYLFGRIGLGGQTAQLASGLVGSVEAARQNSAAAPAAPATPVISRSMVDQEALPVQDLDPGFSVRGLVFFTEEKLTPVTVMVTVDGHKTSMRFDEPATPAPSPTPAKK